MSSVEPGGPAATAGLQDSDIITAVDGTGIRDGSDLRLAIGARNPGEDVEVTVFRDGETKTYSVTLGSLDGVTVASRGPQPGSGGTNRNGASDLAQRFGITGLRTIDGNAPRRAAAAAGRRGRAGDRRPRGLGRRRRPRVAAAQRDGYHGGDGHPGFQRRGVQ